MTDNLETLIETRNTAQAALAEVLLDGDMAAINKARKVVEQAQQAVDDFQIVATELAKRELAAKAERLAADTAARRAKVAEMAEERGKIAGQIEALVEKLGPQYKRMCDLHAEIVGTIPGRIDADRAALTLIGERMMEELARHGLVPGRFPQWELDRRPSLRQQVVEGNAYLRSI